MIWQSIETTTVTLARVVFFAAIAGTVFLSGKPPRASELLQVQKVASGIYAIVGPLTNRTPENLGNNATFGFVVTDEGVVLIDSGASAKGAAALHKLIKTVTDKPITRVINTGGQDHRWLGNGYFKALGAGLVASSPAVEDQQARAQEKLIALGALVGDAGLAGTDFVFAEQRFDNNYRFKLGGIRFELYHAGPAHTPGDSFVWLPQQRVLFSGDIVYVDRLLGVGAQSASRSWLLAFEALARFEPAVVVPGHGPPVTLARARADTYDYLAYLRKAVMEFMEAGGDISDVGRIDQSRFNHLDNFDALKGRNAQRVFGELEWE